MTDPAQPRTLDEIEQEIARQRVLWMHARYEADNDRLPEVQRALAVDRMRDCDRIIDGLLDEWDRAGGRRRIPTR